MGTGLQRDYVLNRMSTYIFFMSFVGDGSIVSTFFAVITTGDNASKTGKILWVGNSAENYVSLTDGVTLHLCRQWLHHRIPSYLRSNRQQWLFP